MLPMYNSTWSSRGCRFAGVLAISTIITIVLSVYVHLYFKHRSNMAVIAAIEGILIVWLVYSYVFMESELID